MGPIDGLLGLEAIKNVRHMHCHCFDRQQVAKLTNLFTEAAVCEFGTS